jgi:hypothetical protein
MEPNVDIKRLPPAQEKIKENQRNKPRVNRVKAKTFKLSTFDTGQYACDDGCLSMRNRTRKTKRKAGKHKTPPQTLSCASHTLRENVMELNVDTKRLPPAQETTWTRELKQNNWYAPQVQIVEFCNWLNAAIVEKRPIRSDQYSKNTNQN